MESQDSKEGENDQKGWGICRKIMDFSRKIIIKYSENGKLPKYPWKNG